MDYNSYMRETLCHLDIKLSNLLISDNDTALLCDFGTLKRKKNPHRNCDRQVSDNFFKMPVSVGKF